MRISITAEKIKHLTILIATSALDAESETLVNAALTALLRGHNTTISIAHRLSTIKRSDIIIVLSPDGKVAEQGTFKDLSANPEGAFSKLMEWQMSGGEPENAPSAAPRGPPSETEEDITSSQHLEADEMEEGDEELAKVETGKRHLR